VLIATDTGVRVQLPPQRMRLPVIDPEPSVEGIGPAARVGEAVWPDSDRANPNLEGLAGARASHLDRADQGVPCVELRIARLEAATGRPAGLEAPARVERRDRDRVSGVDSEHRLEVRREVPVQRAPLERNLVQRHRGVPIQASAGASSTRSPPRTPASVYSQSETACHSSARRSRAISAGT
jgi:hypothetical protein